MSKNRVLRLCLAALFIALGFVLPFLTLNNPQMGNVLLLMHIPVLLCGFICGWQYGLLVGFILPLLRSFILGAPPLYPVAIAMAFELAAYGFFAGFLYSRMKLRGIISIYVSLITAMVAGRLVWGVAQIVLLGIQGKAFAWEAFIGGALINAVPGIIIQIIFIPAVMFALEKAGLLKFKKGNNNANFEGK